MTIEFDMPGEPQVCGTVEGDEVLVEMDAWRVSTALDAAGDAGFSMG